MAFLTLIPEDIKYLVVHCSATPADMDIGAKEIKQWHREKGWLDIGYHFVVTRDGDVETGRHADTPGAHARGYNQMSLGICLVGGTKKDKRTPENNYTEPQMEALRKLLNVLETDFPNAEVIGHRDLPGVIKGCPSFDAGGWYYDE